MAENMSPNFQLGDLSPVDGIPSKDQGKPAEGLPFVMLGSTTDEVYALLTPEQKFGLQNQDSPAYTRETFLSSVSGNSKDQGEPEELPFGMLGSTTDEEYALLTPEQKFGLQNQDSPAYTRETFLSSVSGNSDISIKEGSEAASSSSSSSDAESGTYDLPSKNYLLGDDVLRPKVIELEFDTNGNDENLKIVKEEERKGILEEKDRQYEELIEKVANYEVELELTKNKLQSSQEQIARLKHENMTLVEELGSTIEKLRISEDNMEKMEKNFTKELEEKQKQFQGQLDFANQSIYDLQAELGSERKLMSELQETISKTTNDLNDHSREVEELKHALHEAQKDFSDDISCLHKQKDELERRNNIYEGQIDQYEAEKIEARNREQGLVDEIGQLNKNFDDHKLNYDMLMVEKDEMFAKMQTLAAELNARDTNMLQMEERMSRLATENKQLLDESEKVQKVVEDLRLKLNDQEKEVERQRGIMYDTAEEKREAIRQLCFALEYYRVEYHELREAVIKHKQPAVLAV